MRQAAVVWLIPVLLAARDAPSLENLAGRYSASHPVRVHDGIDRGESIVEIVPVAPDAAYVRIHAESWNNGICGFAQVLTLRQGALMYRQPSGDAPCTLRIGRRGAQLAVEPAGCRAWCGVSADLSLASVPLSSRRPITYLARLKASRQYVAALGAWHRSKPPIDR